MMADLFITFEHLHSISGFSSRAGYCHRGARQLCQRYGIDWQQVVRDGGVCSSVLLKTNDALAIQLVEHAQQVENNGR